MWHPTVNLIEASLQGWVIPLSLASAAWWSTATIATHVIIAVAMFWWLLDSRRQRKTQQQLHSAVAVFDRLFEASSDLVDEVEWHQQEVRVLHEQIKACKEDQNKADRNQFVVLTERLLETNARLIQRLANAEAQLSDQKCEIQKRASVVKRDAQTGLWNRRTFEVDLRRHLHTALDNQSPLALLLLDIDSLRQINDGLGHPAGDRVIQSVVQAIARAIRSSDPLYRYGGDELALILPGASLESARHVAEKIRAAVCRMSDIADLEITVSVSSGLAVVQTGDDSATLMRRADHALSASKENGRNRVSLHDGQRCLASATETVCSGTALPSSREAGNLATMEAPPQQGTMEALDAACDALQQKLDEFTNG
ncbi:MAG: GGDEF domain-containing protein [Pirellulales bacterium]|nr:GGDEF domain-containing protein [Pirellulales bacterium]